MLAGDGQLLRAMPCLVCGRHWGCRALSAQSPQVCYTPFACTRQLPWQGIFSSPVTIWTVYLQCPQPQPQSFQLGTAERVGVLQLFRALDGANLTMAASNADHQLPLFVPRNGFSGSLNQQLQVQNTLPG